MKYPNIIGREVEISTLERLYKSKKSEFVAIYGRRRIGKSYLVSEVYGSKIVFSASESRFCVGKVIFCKEKHTICKYKPVNPL